VVAGLLMVAGATGASTFVPMINLASRVVRAEQRGFAMSLISSAPAFGVLINSALVAAYAGSGHWQMVWSLTGAATIALAVVTHILFGRAGLFDSGTSHETLAPTAGGSASLRSIMPWVTLIFALGFINGLMPYPYLTYLCRSCARNSAIPSALPHGFGQRSGRWGSAQASPLAQFRRVSDRAMPCLPVIQASSPPAPS
jgi:predicted MFS family arabinose efflux permease